MSKTYFESKASEDVRSQKQLDGITGKATHKAKDVMADNGHGELFVLTLSELLDCECTPLILQVLQKGSQRYSQIEFALHKIPPRELSTRLRDLITRGVISRQVQASKPAITIYELTDKGKALREVLQAAAKYREFT